MQTRFQAALRGLHRYSYDAPYLVASIACGLVGTSLFVGKLMLDGGGKYRGRPGFVDHLHMEMDARYHPQRCPPPTPEIYFGRKKIPSGAITPQGVPSLLHRWPVEEEAE